jgi:hypothetical protein
MKKIDNQAKTFNSIVSLAIAVVMTACTYEAWIDGTVGGGYEISLFVECVIIASFVSIYTFISYVGLSALWSAFRKFTK